MHVRYSRICGLALASVLSAQAWQSDPLQRTIKEDRVTKAPVGTQNGKAEEPQSNVPSGRTMNTVLSSTEDLNSIRDAYLRRLAGDGCAPDVAVRVAELKAKLHQDASTTGTQRSSAEIESALFALASDWYKNPVGETAQATGANAAMAREVERARLLDSVLAPRDASAPQAVDPTQLQAELDRLLAGCRAAAH